MAEVLASAVNQVLIDKLISSAFQEIGRVCGVKGEFKKLHQTLTSIHAVLYDAERKQVEEMSVKVWLKQLVDVAYDIEDILGDFEYEALQRKLKIQGRFGNKVRYFFSLSNPLVFRLKMVPKIEDIHQRLNEITTEKHRFDFNIRSSTILDINCSKSSGDRETSSLLVDDPKIVGREFDKSKIIQILFDHINEKETYSVVRIVGIGGLGKTTVAQLVYNDQRVKHHFDIKMWACVSQNSNKKVVYGNLLESINGKKCEVSCLEAMVKSLSESLERKRYLIVLDDIWSDGSIILDDILAELLSMGVKGSSKILVTMRSDEEIPMDSIYTHRLGELPEEDCSSLFEKIAFGRGGAKKTSELVKIGKEIVKKCGGVPLAAKVLGGMMCSKTEEAEWLSIQNSKLWKLPEGKDKITSVLKLSYDHLPPHLKRCFSYCSIFPKDWFIDKEMLIQFWMAEGFLISPLGESKSLENIGKEYFNSLLQNCFLQETEKRNEWGDIKLYKMHDLVHDLALSVVGIEYSFFDGCTIKEEVETEQLRHVGAVSAKDVLTIPQAMYKAKKLRTFVSFVNGGAEMTKTIIWSQTFLNLHYLRVLDLWGIKPIQELPPTFSKLKHLRYLDLGATGIRSLPNTFTSLYNLQTLKLEDCDYLEELPKGMNKLLNLRHLIMSRKTLIQMPLEIGKLSCLRSLPVFIVGKDKGFGIEELKDLNHLGGKLSVCNLENVRDGKDASEAELKEKQNIYFLLLEWTDTSDTSPVASNHHAILEVLQPNRNLKLLVINNYAALTFPTWIMSARCLPNLVSLTLSNCYNCEYLPAFGQLPLLKFLFMEKLNDVKWIGNEFYCSEEEAATRVASPSISFPSLKKLSLKQMPNLEEWSAHMSSSICFPCLEELLIERCSKLKSISSLISLLMSQMVTCNQGSLTRICIQSCSELRGLPQSLLRGNGVLESLIIKDCDNFEGFIPNQESLECSQLDPLLGDATKALFQVCASNSSLENLELLSCPVLEFLPDLRGFNSLRRLDILKCGRLKSLPDGIECLPALEDLRIGPFSRELESFPFPDIGGSEGCNQYFVSLRVLHIYGTSHLKSLPDQFQYLSSLQLLVIINFCSLESLPEWLGNLTSLQYLWIYDCENLKYLPSREQMLRLTSLQHLRITECPLLLREICSGRDQLHKIAHIPKVYDMSQKPEKLVVEYGSLVG